MTDKTRITVSPSSSENSNDSDATAEDGKRSAAEAKLSQQEIIARNREKAIQLRAAKRSLAQEPSQYELHAFQSLYCVVHQAY